MLDSMESGRKGWRAAPASTTTGACTCRADGADCRGAVASGRPEPRRRGARMVNEWGDTATTFDRNVDPWGDGGGMTDEGEGGGEQYIEVIGSQLWVAGVVDLGRFRRVSDFVNLIQGYMVIKDGIVLTRTGDATRLAIPELRLLTDDIAVVGQISDDKAPTSSDPTIFVEKTTQRLVVITRTLMIDGDIFIHGLGSIMAFIEATDPKFIPMLNVRVRWLSDRRLAARFPFALVQRSQILGVATEGIKLASAEQTLRKVERLKATTQRIAESDGLGGEIGSTVPVVDAAAAAAEETPEAD